MKYWFKIVKYLIVLKLYVLMDVLNIIMKYIGKKLNI